MIRWGEKLDQILSGIRDLMHVFAQYGARIQDLKEDQRAMRATLDQILLQLREKPQGPGLAAMLLDEIEEQEDAELRKSEQEEYEQLRKAWALLYGDEVPDA